MARIAGVDLPLGKRIDIGLTHIFGIGRSKAAEILQKAGISPEIRVKNLAESQVATLRSLIESETVEGELRGQVARNIKRLMEIGCYRGLRHRKGLPVRGQRTRTNARTRKKRRKTA